jgi:hypothetical protein
MLQSLGQSLAFALPVMANDALYRSRNLPAASS